MRWTRNSSHTIITPQDKYHKLAQFVCDCRIVQVNPAEKSLERDEQFRIQHYAGDVTYNIIGFIDKNKDPIFQDFKRLLYNR